MMLLESYPYLYAHHCYLHQSCHTKLTTPEQKHHHTPPQAATLSTLFPWDSPFKSSQLHATRCRTLSHSVTVPRPLYFMHASPATPAFSPTQRSLEGLSLWGHGLSAHECHGRLINYVPASLGPNHHGAGCLITIQGGNLGIICRVMWCPIWQPPFSLQYDYN